MMKRSLPFFCALLFAGTLSALDFAAKPWLSHPDAGAVSIQFIGDGPCAGMLEYRFVGDRDWRHLNDTLAGRFVRDRALHRFRLKGTPGAACTCRAVLIDPEDRDNVVHSEEFTIKLPAPDQKNYAFAFMSDFQFNTPRCQELIARYGVLTGMKECDFVVSGGDMSMEFKDWKDDILDKWVLPVRNAFPLLPMVPMRGNHEWRGNETTEVWTRMMRSMETGEPYYCFSYGPDFYVVLDSFEDKPDHAPRAPYTNFHESTEYRKAEKAWLEQVVKLPAFHQARYRIVFCHCPPYAGRNFRDSMYVRELIGETLMQTAPDARVNLMLCGHRHVFARGMPGDNKIYWYKPSEAQQKAPTTGGKDFPFPVIVQDGPGGKCDSSASRINVSDWGIEVITFVEEGTIIDHVRFKPDGSSEVLVSPPGYEANDYPKKYPSFTYLPFQRKK